MPTKAQRARMTHAEKLTLRAYYNVHPELTQEVLTVWAKATFKLPVVPCRIMLSCVLNSHVSAVASNPARKTNHRVTSAGLEEWLLLWVHQCEQYKLLVVTGATVRAKVDKIRRELAISTPDKSAKLKALVFSPGWLSKFQSRHCLTFKRAR